MVKKSLQPNQPDFSRNCIWRRPCAQKLQTFKCNKEKTTSLDEIDGNTAMHQREGTKMKSQHFLKQLESQF